MSNKRKSKHIDPPAAESPVVVDPGANQTPSDIPVRCSHTRMEDIAALVPNPRNPNKHPDKQIAMLAKVIRHQGWRAPIVVSKRSGFIVSGHGRFEAAKLLQVQSVPVDYQEFATDADEWAHLVADNRLAELAEIDNDALKGLLEELDGKIELDLAGFDSDGLEELGVLAESNDVDAEPQIDRAAELQAEWKTERGQVWQLGEHRLMCGDSGVADLVSTLIGSDNPVLIWTDPPYGVSYEEKYKKLEKYRPQNRKSSFVASDDLTEDQTEEIVFNSLSSIFPHAADGCVLYVAAPPGPLHARFQSAFNRAGFSWKHTLVWVKNHFVMGRSDYHYRHEPILYGWKETGAHYFGGGRDKDTVFTVDKPTDSDLHPTMKPVELVQQMVSNSSRSGDIVYEPFSGSGTTIIACERLNRKCRAMEISPAYVAVALQRYKDATVKIPTLTNV